MSRRRTVGIGFSIFLFVAGAILTFALEVDTGSGSTDVMPR
jgi:hypothetical protein